MTGTVRHPFDPQQRPYGFIRPVDGTADVFFHVDDLITAAHDVYEDDQVVYELVEPPPSKGPRAVKVARAGEGEASTQAATS